MRLYCIDCGARRYVEGDLLCADCRREDEFTAEAIQVMRDRRIVPPPLPSPDGGKG